jgi:superoxide reductase
MTSKLQVYKCEVCGNMVEMVHTGTGTLVCCGQPMRLMEENAVDASREKHVPVSSAVDGGVKVAVGAIPHPMQEQHYIEWIEIAADGRTQRKDLLPGDAPEAQFCNQPEQVVVRAYCNLHGLWKG